jgi:hypothetical protein
MDYQAGDGIAKISLQFFRTMLRIENKKKENLGRLKRFFFFFLYIYIEREYQYYDLLFCLWLF